MTWYREGLKFSCKSCGQCCRGPGGYVWVTEEECALMSCELRLPAEVFMKRYVRLYKNNLALIDGPNGDCIFLDSFTLNCKLYPSRPEQCKVFPWWRDVLSSKASWESQAIQCKGMNQGRLWSLSEIEAVKEKDEE